jgi:pilus assembly protein Flp/PilA
MAYIQSFRSEERGQGLVEYALVVGLVAAALVGVLAALGADIVALFTSVTDQIP